MLSGPFIRLVSAALALLAVVAWAIFAVAGVICSFKSGHNPSWLTGDAAKFVLPGLTALVGGVVAVGFGVNPPTTDRGNRTKHNVGSLAKVLTAQPVRAHDPPVGSSQRILASTYVVVYMLLGLAAVVTWVIKGGATLDFVRTLASAWAGLALTIVGAFMRTPTPPPA